MKNYRAQYIEGLATVLWVLYRLYRPLSTFDFFLMCGSETTQIYGIVNALRSVLSLQRHISHLQPFAKRLALPNLKSK